MADTTLRSRLRRLFSTNVIVRNVGGKRLKVADTSRTQSTARSNLIHRIRIERLFRFVVNKVNEVEFVQRL
jgi:hypothetical protein